MSYQGHCKQ